jgi:hypothetical protein
MPRASIDLASLRDPDTGDGVRAIRGNLPAGARSDTIPGEENPMATVDRPSTISDVDMAALRAAVDQLIRGIRDPAEMDRAAQEMDEGREEIRRRLGELDLAVELTDPDE